jgi:hypothetical protein
MSIDTDLSLVLRQVCLDTNKNRVTETLRLLHKLGYNTNIRFHDEKTPLLLAAESKNVWAVGLLIQCGYVPTLEDVEKVIPLLKSYRKENTDNSSIDSAIRLIKDNTKYVKHLITLEDLEREVYFSLGASEAVFEVALDTYLQCGGKIDNVFFGKTTLIFYGIAKRAFENCLILLKRGARTEGTWPTTLYDKDFNGKTLYEIALYWESFLSKSKSLDELIQKLEPPKPVTEVLTYRRTYPNGDVFEGTLVDDKPKSGKLTMANGKVFEGTFVDGKPDIGSLTFDGKTVKVQFTDKGIVLPDVSL